MKVFLCSLFLMLLFSMAYPGGDVSGNMLLLKAGKFQMGDPEGNDKKSESFGFPIVLPSQKETEIEKNFYISKYETTIGEFSDFVQAAKYKPLSETLGAYVYKGGQWFQLKKYNWKNPGYPVSREHPVSCVNIQDIAEFCNYLSKRDGFKPCYSYVEGSLKFDASADGYRLPTEQEWEYAARAGGKPVRKNLFESGKPADNVADQAFMDATKMKGGIEEYNDGFAEAAPVGSLSPNELGIYDMCGNLREITGSWFYEDNNDFLVLKGAGWFTPLDFGKDSLYSSFRIGVSTYGLYSDVGFRVARNAK